MSGPVDDPASRDQLGPIAGSVDPIALVAAVELDQDLAESADGRLARWFRRVRVAIWVLAAAIVTTGIFGVLAAIAAWRESPMIMVLMLVACLPAVVAPIIVARRSGVMADAAGHPKDAARQARDLLGRVQNSPEVAELAALLAMIRRRPSAAQLAATAPKLGRIRSTLRFGRLASALIGRAEPDAHQHRLLAPFTPERLATTWSAVGWSWMGWIVAVIVLVASLVGLVS